MNRLGICLVVLGLGLFFSAPAHAGSLKDALKGAEKDLKEQMQPSDEGKGKDKASNGKSATGKSALGGMLSQGDASDGMKEALAQGVKSAIEQLGREDGFLGDAAVRIGAPKKLRSLIDTARKLGADKYVDAFETSMNRAAEKAVPLAADIFSDAVREMSVEDAVAIVRGEDDSATQYFRKATGPRLQEAFLPVVKKATNESGVTQRYKKLSKKAGGLGGLLGSDDVDLDSYVTDKAMDGLFHYVAERERAIRANPLGQSSDLLRRVFGG